MSSRVSPAVVNENGAAPRAPPSPSSPSPSKLKAGARRVGSKLWSSTAKVATIFRRRQPQSDSELAERAAKFLLKRRWLSWHAMWLKSNETRETLRRSVGRMRNGQLSRGWGAWAEMAATRARQLKALRKSASFMLNGQLTLGFVTWYKLVHRSYDDPIARAVRHMLNRQLTLGFVSWYERVRGSYKDPTARVARFMLNRDLSRSWLSWHAMWLKSNETRETLRRSVGRMRNGQLSRGWGAWAAVVKGRRRLMTRTLCRVIHRHSCLAWTSWLEVARARPLESRRRVQRSASSVAQWRELYAMALAWADWTVQARGYVRQPHYLKTTTASRAAGRAPPRQNCWVAVSMCDDGGGPGAYEPKKVSAYRSPSFSFSRLPRPQAEPSPRSLTLRQASSLPSSPATSPRRTSSAS